MIIEHIKEALLTGLGPMKPAPKNWLKRNCPLCHTRGHSSDKRSRFGIQPNTDSVVANCFNCGFTAVYSEGRELSPQFKTLLTFSNVDEKFIKHIEFEIFKNKSNIVLPSSSSVNFKALINKWQTIELPKDSLPIMTWLEAGLEDTYFLKVVEYAMSRKIYNLEKFYWCPSKSYNLNQRLIIPYYYRNKIVGFTGRLWFNPPDKSTPKYYQQCPSDFVYNLDHQQNYERKYVILNEGVLDAYVTDGIGILGEISKEKINIINKLHKDIIVCPDRDKKGNDLIDIAIDNNWAVSFPKWSRDIKDAADASIKYGKLLTTQSILSSAIYGRDKIKLNSEIIINERKRQRNY